MTRYVGLGQNELRCAEMRTFAVVMISWILSSCGSNHEPAKSAVNCTKVGVNTGVAGAKTGVKTGVEGVKTAGKAVGGLVEGGSEEARRRTTCSPDSRQSVS